MHSKSRLESWKVDPLRLIRERKVKRIDKFKKIWEFQTDEKIEKGKRKKRKT